MTGSEKQIKWATDIRNTFISIINQLMNETEQMTIQKRPDQVKFISIVRAKVDEAVATELSHDDAKYWIDNYSRFDKMSARAFLSPIFKAAKPE